MLYNNILICYINIFICLCRHTLCYIIMPRIIQPISVTRTLRHVICPNPRCKYEWYSTSRAEKRMSCSKCKTSIHFVLAPAATTTTTTTTTMAAVSSSSSSSPQTIRLPLTLIESLSFQRKIAWAKTNGEDYIEIKL